MLGWIHVRTALVLAAALAVAAPLRGEDAKAQLEALHAKLTAPGGIVSVEQAREAAATLKSWRDAGRQFEGPARQRQLHAEVLASLGLGDAAGARAALDEMQKEFADAPATAECAYLAAAAGGDAQLGLQAIKTLAAAAAREDKKRWSVRRRWIEKVGGVAPDVSLPAEAGTISVRKRGSKPLLIDFWSAIPEPDAKHAAALKHLHDELGADGGVELVGVNADAESRLEQAQSLAAKFGYSWPQVYEKQPSRAPITHTAFEAGSPPWLVLIDTYGFVRAVGAADEPAFQYAVRAAVAEARGEFPAVTPRDREGKQPEAAGAMISTAAKPPEAVKPAAGPLPSNPEAASKLRQARAFLKTGKKTDAMRIFREIVRDYPGTQEAQEAQSYLDSNP
ncbi:MAG: hypothetical protein HRF50_08355 [Phycisphaerae bacterium]|jgi:hypothetical protein